MERMESIDNTCPVCHDGFEIFAVGPCDHTVCYRCSTRMRVLCDQIDCPICRGPMPQVAFVYNKVPFKNIHLRNCIPNRKFKIFFEDEKVEMKFLELLEFRCKLCKKRDPDKTFNQLQTHMRRDHQLFACDLCVSHLKIFPIQRKFYTRQTLAIHRRIGDEDDKSYKGHPLCEFCDTRYNDKDELWKHLRKDHFFCHFCDQQGSNEFYDQYQDLMKHFSESHFLCTKDECSSSSTRFTHAFASEIDLKAHKVSAHSENMSKAQSRETRTIELDFQLPPRRMGNNRGNDYENGRNAERNNRRRDRNFEDNLYRAMEASKESANSSQSKPAAEERVPDSVHDFPTLNGATVQVVSTMLRPYNPSLQPKNHEEDFPSLQSQAASKQQTLAPSKQYSSVITPAPIKAQPPPVKPETKPVSLGSVAKTYRPHSAPKVTEDEFPSLGVSQASTNGLSFTTATNASGWIKKNGVQPTKSLFTAPNHQSKKAPSSNSFKDEDNFPFLETGGTRRNQLFDLPLKTKSKKENVEKIPKSEKCDDKFFELPDSYYVSFDEAKQYCIDNDVSLDNDVRKEAPSNTLNEFPDLPVRTTKQDNSKNEQKKKKKNKKESLIASKLILQSSSDTNSSLNDIALALVTGTHEGKQKPTKPKDWFDNPQTSDDNFLPVANHTNEKQPNHTKYFPEDSIAIKASRIERDSPVSAKLVPESFDTIDNSTFSIDNDDFPSLHSMSTSVQLPKPPPGFSGVQGTKDSSSTSLSAPPGFKSAPCPPPGFGAVAPVYIQPPNFKERNLKLINDIKEALDEVHEGFNNFRALSGQFRQGGMEASDYYFSCLTLMGDTKFESIFPELLALLPDISKQKDLWEVHLSMSKPKSKKWIELLLCPACGQVILKQDTVVHDSQHNSFSEFPALSTNLSNFNKLLCK